jgi:transposase
MAYIKGETRQQITMFPESIDDYISEDNPVRFIEAFVMNLNLAALGFKHSESDSIGRPPYDPRDMLKLYLYGYLNRIRSSRKLETEAGRNLELLWLMRKLKPDFKTIADFRKDNKKAIREIFKQFSLLCKEWDLYGQAVVAVDGSKFRASNAKRSNFSKKKLNRHIKYIDEKIDQYLNDLEEGDQAEAGIHKPTAEEINQRIKELKSRKLNYEEMLQSMQESGIQEISTTDPDARLMAVNNNGIEVCYNVQTVVDGKHSLVVDCEVINNPTDHGQLSTMGKLAQETFAKEEIKVLADKGYYSAQELKACKEAGLETYVAKQRFANRTEDEGFYTNKFSYNQDKDYYICPTGKTLFPANYRKTKGQVIGRNYRNYKACQTCEIKERCTKSKRGRMIYRNINQSLLDEVDQRTRENKELYVKRQMIVEHPFGTIKRNWGYGHFLTRRLESVRTETCLAFLAYNMARVINILGVKELIKRLQPV